MHTPWQNSPLRTYPVLSENIEVDVCIAGGGISGMSTAYLLQERGYKVALLERNRLASGVSGYTSGHLTALIDYYYHKIVDQYSPDEGRWLYKACGEAHGLLQEIRDAFQLEFPHEKMKACYFAGDEQQLKLWQKEKDTLQSFGVNLLENLNTGLPLPHTALFALENQMILDAPAFIQALANELYKRKVLIYENSAVLDFETVDKGVKIQCGDYVVKARHFIQATHTPLKINPIQLETPQYNSYVIMGESSNAIEPAMYFDFAEPYHYMRPLSSREPHKWIIGGFDHKTGSGEDEAAQMEKLRQWSRTHFGIEKFTHSWSSMIFNSPDYLPFIGVDPVHDNCYLATGFSGDGLTFGLMSALINSSLIEGEIHPLAPLLKPGRFHLISTPEIMKKGVEAVQHLIVDRFALNGQELKEIRAGEGKILKLDGQRVGVHVDENMQISAVVPVCPHMGCMLKWNNFAHSWDCGCHGSRFSHHGEVLSGPATENLDKVQIDQDQT